MLSFRTEPQVATLSNAAVSARILRTLFSECKPDGMRSVEAEAEGLA